MQSYKRNVILVLATSAALFSLFWVTAFSSEMVSERESGKAGITHAIAMTPIGISNTATVMDVNITIIRKGGNGHSS